MTLVVTVMLMILSSIFLCALMEQTNSQTYRNAYMIKKTWMTSTFLLITPHSPDIIIIGLQKPQLVTLFCQVFTIR